MVDTDSNPTRPDAERQPYATTSGALLASAPLPFALAAWGHGGFAEAPPWVLVLAGTIAACLCVAGISIGARPRPGRRAGAAAVLLLPVLALERLIDAPALLLSAAIGMTTALVLLGVVGEALLSPRIRRGHGAAGRARGAAVSALLFWVVATIGPDPVAAVTDIAVGVSQGIAVGLGAWWVLHHGLRMPRGRLLLGAMVASLTLTFAVRGDRSSMVGCMAIYTLVATFFGPRPSRRDGTLDQWWTSVLEHPERMLAATFATMCLIGTVVLALPQSSATGVGIGGLDAAFTAVSAVCVTGLIVVDTPVAFSGFGQGVMLVLIQLGGLGIMTFSAAALRMLGGRLSFRQESAVASLLGARDRSRLVASAQDVLRVTFVCEGVGAAVLAALFFLGGDDLASACWRGTFTAVSAFCNAGFALQSDSLVPFRSSPLVLHTIAVLIVIGGLSPAVVLALAARGGRRVIRPLAVQVRLCVVVTALLLLFGFVFFLLSEWDGVLRELSFVDKLHNAWFQSVTLRTAGFNSVDLAAVYPGTWLLMLAMMFVGACPGGTGGGVKTTTFGVLLLSIVHTIRGARSTSVFGRRLPAETLQRAAVVVLLGALSAFFGLLALLLTQSMPTDVALFEVVSALATVGLSQNGTAQLDEVGKLIVIVCMFVGRIGAISVMMFMSQRSVRGGVVLPVEDVDVG